MKHFFAAALFLIAPLVQAADPLIIAHRGVPYYAPENTTPSMQLALDLKADGVETDVYLTADNKVMVMHDRTTSRTAMGINHVMKETNSDVLEKVDVGRFKDAWFKGTTIPYLKDILDITPTGKLVVIEIKDEPDTVPPVKELLQATGRPWSDFAIISFNFDTCVAAREQMPEIEVYYLEGATDKKTKKPKNFDKSVLERAKDANLTGVDLDYRGVTKELVQQCHEMGMKFWVWTVNEDADIKRMAEYGVDGITTNVCEQARKLVEARTKK